MTHEEMLEEAEKRETENEESDNIDEQSSNDSDSIKFFQQVEEIVVINHVQNINIDQGHKKFRGRGPGRMFRPDLFCPKSSLGEGMAPGRPTPRLHPPGSKEVR